MSENLNVSLKIHATSYLKFIAFDYLLNKQNLFNRGILRRFYCEIYLSRLFVCTLEEKKKIQNVHYRKYKCHVVVYVT